MKMMNIDLDRDLETHLFCSGSFRNEDSGPWNLPKQPVQVLFTGGPKSISMVPSLDDDLISKRAFP